ncbi:MAG: hypothetical protein IJ438_04370 [Clostridia bacterium]|nr:hypothetical protein [Clostridia bacterium]
MDTSRTNTLYTEAEHSQLRQQMRRRWIVIAIPCVILLIVMVYSAVIRLEWLTSAAIIGIGVILIAGYDFAIKPLRCYDRHVDNALHGRTREAELPFVALSEDISVVDGVSYRALTCSDIDGKGRPYDRLFYFDALKTLPDFKEGEMVRITHHDLEITDITRA